MISVRVNRRQAVAEDIISLELASASGEPLPPYSAGAHIDVELPNGMTRQYSLLGDPERRDMYEIAILREAAGRGGSASAHRDLHAGTQMRIGAPRNLFPLVPAQRSILFAGGIGITPILCMAQQLQRTGREFELHYCSRSRTRAAFLDRIANADFAPRVNLHFDDGEPAQRLDAHRVLERPDPDTHLYVCGPRGFMDHVIDTATAHGWARGNIHYEFFSAPTEVPGGGGFEIRLARSGRTIPVAADQSAAAALAEHGVPVPLSCEQGICGTCVTRVLEGIPEHRDMYLGDAEKAANDCFTPCCSRSKTPLLVVDL